MSFLPTVTLLTPPGVGALAVVRISGAKVGRFLQTHFSGKAEAGRCVHGTLADGTDVLDDPVVVVGPQSAFADINLHGGPWVTQRTIELAERFGFVRSMEIPTDEAESEIEREVMQSLPAARTQLAARILLAQPAAWVAMISRNQPDEIRAALEDEALANLLRLPQVAIVGMPNAGKSTLANRLFGTERSITADLPGTTRDWVGDVADINGLAVMLMDTPGQRETADPIERRAIELARERTRRVDLTIHLLDASLPDPPANDSNQRQGTLAVLNKADHPCTWRNAVRVDVETVATTGRGVDELQRRIVATFQCDNLDPSKARCWTNNQRQRLRAV
jgi:small GTP-binding protein